MKAFAPVFYSLLLLTLGTVPTFAQDKDSFTYAVREEKLPDVSTVGSVDVPVTQAIRDWFQAHTVRGFVIDGSKIDAPLGSLSARYKDAIDALVEDTSLDNALYATLIRPTLQAALVRGKVEEAKLRIGRHVWVESIVGPEDYDYPDATPANATHH